MRIRIIALAFIFLVFGGFAMAQVYTVQTSSVNSATVPVNVLPVGAKKTWCVRPRTGAAASLLCFPYNGAIPTAVPTASAVQELSAGQPLCDKLEFTADTALNEAWACVLETGSTTVTTDATFR